MLLSCQNICLQCKKFVVQLIKLFDCKLEF
jgi:hypothetical protein